MPGARRGPRAGRDGARSGRGGFVVDYRACELFPSAGSIWFRAARRHGDAHGHHATGLPEPKLQENLQCETEAWSSSRKRGRAAASSSSRNEAGGPQTIARVAAWRYRAPWPVAPILPACCSTAAWIVVRPPPVFQSVGTRRVELMAAEARQRTPPSPIGPRAAALADKALAACKTLASIKNGG